MESDKQSIMGEEDFGIELKHLQTLTDKLEELEKKKVLEVKKIEASFMA